MTTAATRVRKATAEAESFNANHPVGTPVRYWSSVKRGDPSGSGATMTPAQLMSDTAVVWIDGVRGCIALSHVEVAK